MPRPELIVPASGFPRVGAPRNQGARVWLPPNAQNSSSVFQTYTYAALAAIPDPTPIIDGVLFAASFAAIIGVFSTFKSFLALSIALSVAMGMDWFGRSVVQGYVIYVYGEGGPGMRRRALAWARVHGVDVTDRMLFIPQSVVMTDAEQVAQLERTILALGIVPKLVIFDTVARCFRGNENSAEDMTRFVEHCDRLRHRTGAAVLVVHHTGWQGEHSRGSTVLPAALDTEITVERDGDRAIVKCTKQKDAEPFQEFTLEFFAVNNTGSGVLLAIRHDDARLSANQVRLLNVLQSMSNAGPVSSTDWRTSSAMPKSSYDHARNALLRGAYVRTRSGRYEVTETGRLYLSGRGPTGPMEVQSEGTPSGRGGPTVSGAISPE